MKLHRIDDNHVSFVCPGCDGYHVVNVSKDGWGWNGSMESPSFTPSILLRSGHYAPGHHGDSCWCTYNATHYAEHPEDISFKCGVCHSFVVNGKIQFLNDCTHELSGQTVDIPDWV